MSFLIPATFSRNAWSTLLKSFVSSFVPRILTCFLKQVLLQLRQTKFGPSIMDLLKFKSLSFSVKLSSFCCLRCFSFTAFCLLTFSLFLVLYSAVCFFYLFFIFRLVLSILFPFLLDFFHFHSFKVLSTF